MASCPHCSEAIPGFVTRDTLKEQLKAKDDAAALLTAELTKARGELEGVADIRKAHEEATAKIAKMERTALLTSKGITDPAIIETMEILHKAKTAGAEEPVPFEDFEAWGATTNPLLAKLFAGAGGSEQEKPPEGSPPPRVPPNLPTNDANAGEPPPKQGKPTPAQIQARFRDPAFQALPREERQAEIAALKAQVGA